MRILLVANVQLNPYVRLLAEGLRTAGANVRLAAGLSLPGLLRQRWRGLDVLHLHWLELLYEAPTSLRSAWRLLNLLLTLVLARLLGVTLVYTVHNFTHHEGRYPRLNDLGNRALYRLAHALHVHDDAAAQALTARLPAAALVYVVAHGSYIGAYPNTVGRAQARTHLGLDDASVVLFFGGGIRPYKGLELLLAAFAQITDPQARLLIAGHAHQPAYAATIQALADQDARVRLALRHLPDDELQFYYQASDACVLPYRAVATSGAALLALSFGCPLVAPHRGPFPALTAGGRGLLFEPDSVTGLAEALRQANRFDAATRRACLTYAQGLAWPALAQAHLAAYRRASGGRAPC